MSQGFGNYKLFYMIKSCGRSRSARWMSVNKHPIQLFDWEMCEKVTAKPRQHTWVMIDQSIAHCVLYPYSRLMTANECEPFSSVDLVKQEWPYSGIVLTGSAGPPQSALTMGLPGEVWK